MALKPLNSLILKAIIDPEWANKVATDPSAAADEFGLSDADKAALNSMDRTKLTNAFSDLNNLVSGTDFTPAGHLSISW